MELDKIVDSKNVEVPVPKDVNLSELFGGTDKRVLESDTTIKLVQGYVVNTDGSLWLQRLDILM